jgi:hypothetical protein
MTNPSDQNFLIAFFLFFIRKEAFFVAVPFNVGVNAEKVVYGPWRSLFPLQ